MNEICVTCGLFERWLSKETGHGGWCQFHQEPMRLTDTCGDWLPKSSQASGGSHDTAV